MHNIKMHKSDKITFDVMHLLDPRSLPRSSVATLRELQSTMSSNGDPVVSMVVAEDAAVVVAFDDNDGDMQAAMHSVAKSKRKCQKHQFPWEYVKDWQDGDSTKHCGKHQCTVCHKWYSGSTNASSWKAHMKSTHGITGSDTASSTPSGKVMF